MLVSPLEGHLNPAKNALADRLQWARSSIRKKLDMSDQQESPKAATPKKNATAENEIVKVKPQEPVTPKLPLSNGTSIDKKDEPSPQKQSPVDSSTNSSSESENNTKPSPVRSPERHVITCGDPLGALDSISEVARSTPTAPEPVTPAKPFVLPDSGVRLFTRRHSTSSSDSSSNDSSTSSSDDSSEESESEEESDHSHENESSASRLSIR